ncbi:MAG: DMT family transporter [Rhizobiaceae bacterium]
MSIRNLFTTRNTLLAGVLLMLLGDFVFSLLDALAKWLATSFPIGQVILIRSLASLLFLSPMILRQGVGDLFRVDRPGVQMMRVVAITIDVFFFYLAVVALPLADVLSFYMAGPIYVAALSHFMLGERIGWRRWLAIGVGFVGVLIILRPTSGVFSFGSLWAIVGSFGFAFAIVFARMLRGTSDTVLVTWQTIGAVLVAGVLAVGNWVPATSFDYGAMVLLGLVSCVAHMLITRALKLAPASILAPLHYTLMLWAVVFGWVFFGDVPGWQTLLGAAIVVLAGLFIVHRQKVKAEVPPENVPSNVN